MQPRFATKGRPRRRARPTRRKECRRTPRLAPSIKVAAKEGRVECRIRTVVITEQHILMFEPRVKNQGLSQGAVFDFLLKEEVA
jgi:hypothetical protein